MRHDVSVRALSDDEYAIAYDVDCELNEKGRVIRGLGVRAVGLPMFITRETRDAKARWSDSGFRLVQPQPGDPMSHPLAF